MSRLSEARDRSRSVRERSTNLRLTSKQLRDSLENLRVGAAEVQGVLPEHHRSSTGPEHFSSPVRSPLDFAALIRQRVHKSRTQAQALRRRAADLRSQAAQFRARSENLRSNSTAL